MKSPCILKAPTLPASSGRMVFGCRDAASEHLIWIGQTAPAKSWSVNRIPSGLIAWRTAEMVAPNPDEPPAGTASAAPTTVASSHLNFTNATVGAPGGQPFPPSVPTLNSIPIIHPMKTFRSFTKRRTDGPLASASLLAGAHVTAADFAEGNAAEWGSFGPDWEEVASSVRDTTNLLRVGNYSLRFGTGWLSFWTWSENGSACGFQGNQPVIVLNCAGGSFRHIPDQQLVKKNHAWTFHRIPLTGDVVWRCQTEGAPSLANVHQFEIHQDTWHAGFMIWYDAAHFELKPQFDVPLLSNGVFHSTAQVPDGMECVLMTSTNLILWTPVATNSTTGGLLEWMHPADQPRQCFGCINPDGKHK